MYYLRKETKVLYMEKEDWLLCPLCRSKTRIKVREDTQLIRFPLFCHKCKREVLINVVQLYTTIIKELGVQPQSR